MFMKNKFEKDDIIRFDEENKDLPNHDYIGLIILLHLRYVWLVFRKKKRDIEGIKTCLVEGINTKT